MNDLSCRIDYDNEHRGSEAFIKKEAFYWLDPQGRMYERTSYGINKSLLMGLIVFLIIILIIVCICILFTKNSLILKEEESKNTEKQIAIEEDVQKETVGEAPTIGERCSNSYLTNEEIRKLYEQEGPDQLQFYINLMYARHGNTFEKGSNNDLYFSEQDWYQKLEKKVVCYEDLNEFEKKNVDLFSIFLEEKGYRK